MNRHVEDFPPVIRHLCVILFLVLICLAGNWMQRNNWPYSKTPAKSAAAPVNQRTAQINAVSVQAKDDATAVAENQPAEKPSANQPSPAQSTLAQAAATQTSPQ